MLCLFGRAYGLYGYAAKASQHLTVLFTMIAHPVGIGKKMIDLCDFANVEPPHLLSK